MILLMAPGTSCIDDGNAQFSQPMSAAGDGESQSHQHPLYDMITLDNGGTPLQSQGKDTSKQTLPCQLLLHHHSHTQSPSNLVINVSTTENPSLPMNGDAIKISHLSSQLDCLHSTSAAASFTHVPQEFSTVHAPSQKTASPKVDVQQGYPSENFLSNNSSSSLMKKHVIGSSLLQSPTLTWRISLPGYEALDRAHTILQGHSNNELAFHVTRADAVCFLLTPRPAEDKKIWKQR